MVGGRDMNGLGCIFAKTKTQDPCNVEQSWEVRDEKEYIDDTSIVVDECPAGTVPYSATCQCLEVGTYVSSHLHLCFVVVADYDPASFETGICGCCFVKDCGAVCCFHALCCKSCVWETSLSSNSCYPLASCCPCFIFPCIFICAPIPIDDCDVDWYWGWCCMVYQARGMVADRYRIRTHKGVNFFFAFCCTPCAYIQLINQILIKEDLTWGSWGH